MSYRPNHRESRSSALALTFVVALLLGLGTPAQASLRDCFVNYTEFVREIFDTSTEGRFKTHTERMHPGEAVTAILETHAGTPEELQGIVDALQAEGVSVESHRKTNGKYEIEIRGSDKAKLQKAAKLPGVKGIAQSKVLTLGRLKAEAKAKAEKERDPSKPRKIVILSSTFGGGHESAAKAIKANILATDPTAIVEIKEVDGPTGLRSQRRDNFERENWWWMIKNYPRVYDFVFKASMAIGGQKALQGFLPQHVPEGALLKYIQEQNPDTVIVAHQLTALPLASLVNQGKLDPRIRIGFMHTDYYSGGFVTAAAKGMRGDGNRAPTKLFVAHPVLAGQFVKEKLRPDEVTTTGMPIAPHFFEAIDSEKRLMKIPGGPERLAELKLQMSAQSGVPVEKLDAKAVEREAAGLKLGRETFLRSKGLDPKKRTITIMSGSEGVGDFPTLIDELSKKYEGTGLQIIANCGNNTKWSKEKLVDPEFQALMKKRGITLVVNGKIPLDDVFNYVKSSDLYITKSGGLSPTEAFAMNVPVVLLGGVYGGHEKLNAELFGRLGLATINWHEKDIAGQVDDLLNDKEKQARMAERQREFVSHLNFQPITDFALGRDGQAPTVRAAVGGN